MYLGAENPAAGQPKKYVQDVVVYRETRNHKSDETLFCSKILLTFLASWPQNWQYSSSRTGVGDRVSPTPVLLEVFH